MTSNPQLWDSDDDGLADGEEDANRNGAADLGETHFSKNDSDGDGLLDVVVGDLPGRVTFAPRLASKGPATFGAEKPILDREGKPLRFHNW